MEPIIFTTTNNNCYLYSPYKKSLLPLPNTYVQLKHNVLDNKILSTLEHCGYMGNYTDPFDGMVDGLTIKRTLENLSQVVFETTTACNLRCEYCCYGEGYSTFDNRRLKYGHLKFEMAKSILDYLAMVFKNAPISNAPAEPFAISFYGGEPLANFDVVKEIVEYSENLTFRNRTLTFTMTTNATLLSKYADFLQKHNFKILVSLDGSEKHNVYRKTNEGKPSFEIVMANLRHVNDRYPKWFRTFRFNAVYTNKSDIEEIVKWYKETFNKIPNFSPLHTPSSDAKESQKIQSMLKDFEIPEKLCDDKDLFIQNPLFNRILVMYNKLIGYSKNKENNILEYTQHNIPTGTCVPFSKRMFISFDGKIHPCEKVNRDSPLGEILSNGEVSINYAQIADDFMKIISKAVQKCQNCYLQLCCTKCLACYNDGNCDSYVNKEQFTEILSQSISYIESHPNIITDLENNVIIK